MEHERDWPARLAEQVGREIARLRDQRGMTAQALADRCAELGLPMDRAVIAKLEKGRRQTITVGELLVFARALRVPPLLLVCPVGHLEVMEVNPGIEASPWAAAQWFTGEDEFIGRGEWDPVTGLHEWYEGAESGWKAGSAPIRLYRRHAAEVAEYLRAPEYARGAGDTEEQSLRLLMQWRKTLAERITHLREEMRQQGITPPPLPRGLSHLDERG